MTNFFEKLKESFNNLTKLFKPKLQEDELEARSELCKLFSKKRPLEFYEFDKLAMNLEKITEESGIPIINKGLKKIKTALVEQKRKANTQMTEKDYKKFIKNEFKRVYDIKEDKCKRFKKLTRKEKEVFIPEYEDDIQFVVLPKWWDMTKPDVRDIAKSMTLDEIMENDVYIKQSEIPEEKEAEWYSEKNVKKLNKYYKKKNFPKCGIKNGCEKCVQYVINRKIEKVENEKIKLDQEEEDKWKEGTINYFFKNLKFKNILIDRVVSYEDKLWYLYLFYDEFKFEKLDDREKGIFLNVLKKKNIVNFQEIFKLKNENSENSEKSDNLENSENSESKLKKEQKEKEICKLKNKVDFYINSDEYRKDIKKEEKKNIAKRLLKEGHRPKFKEDGFEFPHIIYVHRNDTIYRPEIFRPGQIAKSIFHKRHPRYRKYIPDVYFEGYDEDITNVQNIEPLKPEIEEWKQDIRRKQEIISEEMRKEIENEIQTRGISLETNLTEDKEKEAEIEYCKMLKKRYIDEVKMIKHMIKNEEYFKDLIPNKTSTLVLNDDTEENRKLYKRCKEVLEKHIETEEKFKKLCGDIQEQKVNDTSEKIKQIKEEAEKVYFEDKWYQNKAVPREWEYECRYRKGLVDIPEEVNSINDDGTSIDDTSFESKEKIGEQKEILVEQPVFLQDKIEAYKEKKSKMKAESKKNEYIPKFNKDVSYDETGRSTKSYLTPKCEEQLKKYRQGYDGKEEEYSYKLPDSISQYSNLVTNPDDLFPGKNWRQRLEEKKTKESDKSMKEVNEESEIGDLKRVRNNKEIYQDKVISEEVLNKEINFKDASNDVNSNQNLQEQISFKKESMPNVIENTFGNLGVTNPMPIDASKKNFFFQLGVEKKVENSNVAQQSSHQQTNFNQSFSNNQYGTFNLEPELQKSVLPQFEQNGIQKEAIQQSVNNQSNFMPQFGIEEKTNFNSFNQFNFQGGLNTPSSSFAMSNHSTSKIKQGKRVLDQDRNSFVPRSIQETPNGNNIFGNSNITQEKVQQPNNYALELQQNYSQINNQPQFNQIFQSNMQGTNFFNNNLQFNQSQQACNYSQENNQSQQYTNMLSQSLTQDYGQQIHNRNPPQITPSNDYFSNLIKKLNEQPQPANMNNGLSDEALKFADKNNVKSIFEIKGPSLFDKIRKQMEEDETVPNDNEESHIKYNTDLKPFDGTFRFF